MNRAPTGSSTPLGSQRKAAGAPGAASLQAWNAEGLADAHAAAAALLQYAEHTQGRPLTHLHGVRVQQGDALIRPAGQHRRNLELVKTLRGEDGPTLFSLLDSCMTGMGSRLLKNWLLARAQSHRRAPAPGRHAGSARRWQRPGPWQLLRERTQGRERRGAHHARIALRQVRPRELVALCKTLQKQSF